MNHTEGTFKGVNDLSIYYQSWRPDGDSRATILLVHGLGEHSGRYPKLVDTLVPKGYTIHALDHRGHGKSGASGAAHVMDFSEFRFDLHTFRLMVEEWEGKRPLFLYGHSMGGLITLNYVLHHPERIRAVVASAPAVGTLPIAPHLRLITGLLSRLAPTLQVATGLATDGLSRIPEVMDAYLNDPLVHGKATPRFGAEMPRAAAWTMDNAGELEPPLLVVHGEADPIVPVQNSRDFFARVQQPDKKLVIYPGGMHESHNDLQADELMVEVENWLEAHL